MSEIILTLLPKYFNKIKKGEKIYEVRLKKDKYNDIKINDIIIFLKKPDLKEKIKTKVNDIILYKSFNEMVDSLPFDLLGFKGYEKNEIIKVYKNIYPDNKEEEIYGIIVFKISLI
jgi:ASC-1-like (ASCH) protein